MSDSWREVVVSWQAHHAFIGSNPTGGEVQIGLYNDKPGLSPMELLLAGVAGCTGADVVSILEKKRKTLDDMVITVRGKRAEEHPRIYTEINIYYALWGEDLDSHSVEQAIQLSQEKYCSVSAMLGCLAKIAYTYEIHNQRK